MWFYAGSQEHFLDRSVPKILRGSASGRTEGRHALLRQEVHCQIQVSNPTGWHCFILVCLARDEHKRMFRVCFSKASPSHGIPEKIICTKRASHLLRWHPIAWQEACANKTLFNNKMPHLVGGTISTPVFCFAQQTELDVFRKSSKNLPNLDDSDSNIDWEETVYLNLILQQVGRLFDHIAALRKKKKKKIIIIIHRHPLGRIIVLSSPVMSGLDFAFYHHMFVILIGKVSSRLITGLHYLHLVL